MEADVTSAAEVFFADLAAVHAERKQQGMAFSALDEPKLRASIAANMPAIWDWSWWPDVEAGKPTYVEFNIGNATNQFWHSVNLSLFFGPAQFITDIGQAIAGRDNRMPYLSARTELLATATQTRVRIDYTVPADIPAGIYFGNAVLWWYEQLWDRKYYHQNVLR